MRTMTFCVKEKELEKIIVMLHGKFKCLSQITFALTLGLLFFLIKAKAKFFIGPRPLTISRPLPILSLRIFCVSPQIQYKCTKIVSVFFVQRARKV